MIVVLLLAFDAALYQLAALVAALWHVRRKEPVPSSLPPVSILKPVRGLEPHFYESIRSHAVLDYPEYEVLFGVSDPEDPALPEIRRLIEEFPGRRLRLVMSTTRAANGKVGVLIDLKREARYPLLLVNDSDILVQPDYLRRVVAPLEKPGVGLVTCLYRANSDRWPGRWEGIGIATDFAPSVLVAPLVGVREFGLGATLLFRDADLAAVGGFEALADYLADDFQLARHLTRAGHRVVLARTWVQTQLAGRSWSEVWRHQVRWARTIRVSRPDGYAGLMFANASLWAVVALAAGAWKTGLALLALRILVGLVVGFGILRSPDVLRYFYWMPFRDLWGAGVWLCGLAGKTVEWRDAHLRLTRDGRIVQTLRPAESGTKLPSG